MLLLRVVTVSIFIGMFYYCRDRYNLCVQSYMFVFSLTKEKTYVSHNAGFVVFSSNCHIIPAFRHTNNCTYDRTERSVSLLVLTDQRLNMHL